jgi:hypothetical protein
MFESENASTLCESVNIYLFPIIVVHLGTGVWGHGFRFLLPLFSTTPLLMYNANSYNRISFFYVRINIIDRYNLLCIIYSQILTGAWGMDFVSPKEILL